MKMIIKRETLLEPLQLIAGVVEKRQTLPVLSSVLINVQKGQLSLIGTNLEIELICRIPLNDADVLEAGEVAAPAHKLMDICRLLPEASILEISFTDAQLTIKSQKSRFVLSTFSVEDFPSVEEESSFSEFLIPQARLRELFEKTSFSMADQDARHFLNGLQIQIHSEGIKGVAADGHRIAFGELVEPMTSNGSAIVPRKGIHELLKLLESSEDKVVFGLSDHHIRLVTEHYTFTSKLIDNVFIDYEDFLPKDCDKSFVIDREKLKQAAMRIAILSNEKIRSIRLQVKENKVKILASNVAQEYAEEEITLDSETADVEISFCANYLLEALSVIRSKLVELSFASSQHGFLVKEPDQNNFVYVLMPIL